MHCGSPSDSQIMMSLGYLITKLPTSCVLYSWLGGQWNFNMVICAAYKCHYRSDRVKGKGISRFTFPNTRIKWEKKDLTLRLLFNTWTEWTGNTYTFSCPQRVCDEHFEKSCFEVKLQKRLRFSKVHLIYLIWMSFLQEILTETEMCGFLILYPQHQGYTTLHFGFSSFLWQLEKVGIKWSPLRIPKFQH